MDAEKLIELEYESLQAEKRDRMNARLQVWSLFFAMVGAFGLVSVQSNEIGFLVALYPLLASCLARYTSHSEEVLGQVKARLLALEKESHFQGYEHVNQQNMFKRKVGGHIKAFRDALLMTDMLAVVAAGHLLIQINWLVVALVLPLEMFSIWVTLTALSKRQSAKKRLWFPRRSK